MSRLEVGEQSRMGIKVGKIGKYDLTIDGDRIRLISNELNLYSPCRDSFWHWEVMINDEIYRKSTYEEMKQFLKKEHDIELPPQKDIIDNWTLSTFD